MDQHNNDPLVGTNRYIVDRTSAQSLGFTIVGSHVLKFEMLG